ncbi:ABC transporter ATP-binding protein [Bryobacter aggregatus]|uniref:ABC transporter ATP-binding protein n=1 Tax=Bryobacter aggregatus TaxID=360054 RepID=UPI000689BC40|nr:ABC transporter ATP-binding protein [Bryobacter aggregatus]
MSIRVEALSYHYGNRPALEGIDFQLEPGTLTALLGSNGAGKSTLFKILCGLLQPRTGWVAVNGYRLPGQKKEARQSIGYVAQRFALYEDLSVEENLRFFAQAYGLSRLLLAARMDELLDRFELASRRRQRASSLSQGWKQRLAFAVALAHRPTVLLLDEVTAGLDAATRHYAWKILEEEAARGATVLLSTHHEDEAARCTMRVWLEQGRQR